MDCESCSTLAMGRGHLHDVCVACSLESAALLSHKYISGRGKSVLVTMTWTQSTDLCSAFRAHQ